MGLLIAGSSGGGSNGGDGRPGTGKVKRAGHGVIDCLGFRMWLEVAELAGLAGVERGKSNLSLSSVGHSILKWL